MTTNERILLADDMLIVLETAFEMIQLFGEKDGHVIVGKAQSVEEVKKLLEEGLRPTVALVDNSFPLKGDGQRAAEIIRKISPETKVISFSMDTGLTWGDENWYKGMGSKEVVQALTNLQH
jgi:DNA-binding NarL/FixJ family response regulator